jgi:ABC-type polysaccharide/polyol phosphate transport system ATPase subunit
LTTTLSNPGEARETVLARAPVAVSVSGLTKAFRLPHQRYTTLKERALHPFAAKTYDQFQALHDISFDVRKGEFFGIVGRNGSGKSTLLKCLAGIYRADGGNIELSGRVSPFLELGVGFNPDLTARDNVLINAIMLGLTRKEARAQFDRIIEFAELEEFVDLKLKNYSTGMGVRLGFSVAVQLEADVLLVDEVLAVGDASFQQKCFAEFDRLKNEGRTILFVTHDMNSVERFCDRGVVLERGELVDHGAPERVARTYGQLNFGKAPPAGLEHDDSGEGTRGDVRFLAGWTEGPGGERQVVSAHGEVLTVCVELSFTEAVEDPHFTLTFANEARHAVFIATTQIWADRTGRFEAGERTVLRYRFANRLAPGRYTVTALVGDDSGAYGGHGYAEDVLSFLVEARFQTGGLVDLPFEFTVERR